MQPVTYGSLQGALLEGLAKAAPAAAKRALPYLSSLLANLDTAWPAIVIAGRAIELMAARKSLPNPEAIVGAFTRAAREVANTELAREWMKRKPIWRS